ncbi:MAG: hypothetical protein ACD_78C00080G0001 [uncultured bacterium (gcode 4)]|uniref:Uncharacterized protein n=1 Tax=uncultured bacterium (gcode 4) TaxID=1234023 RepID=K1XYW0_9BACT|nr:MAG: hypothetical protein ACD_78C00080G0001 [uncultured bacterium (gcode 4)]
MESVFSPLYQRSRISYLALGDTPSANTGRTGYRVLRPYPRTLSDDRVAGKCFVWRIFPVLSRTRVLFPSSQYAWNGENSHGGVWGNISEQCRWTHKTSRSRTIYRRRHPSFRVRWTPSQFRHQSRKNIFPILSRKPFPEAHAERKDSPWERFPGHGNLRTGNECRLYGLRIDGVAQYKTVRW